MSSRKKKEDDKPIPPLATPEEIQTLAKVDPAAALDKTLEEIDLFLNSRTFVKKLEQEKPGGGIEFMMKQIDSIILINHELQLGFYKIMFCSHNPFVKAEALTNIAVLSKVAANASAERAVLQKMMAEAPKPADIRDLPASSVRTLPSESEWESMFADSGSTPPAIS